MGASPISHRMKELLFSVTKKDFDISYFNGKGKGGQHRNKHANCVRIKHRESGATGVGQSERSLTANKRNAFMTCVKSPKFQMWLKIKTSRCFLNKQDIEKLVEDGIKEENLKIEYF